MRFWTSREGFGSVEQALLDAAQVFLEGQRSIGLVKHTLKVGKVLDRNLPPGVQMVELDKEEA